MQQTANGYVTEDQVDELRIHMAEMLQSDLMEDEAALEYLIEYGVHRAGMDSPDALTAWMRDTLRQSRMALKGQTSGSAAKDMMAFLLTMDRVGGRGPEG